MNIIKTTLTKIRALVKKVKNLFLDEPLAELAVTCNWHKLEGMSQEEFFSFLVRSALCRLSEPDKVRVILYDINPGAKDSSFWSKMPALDVAIFRNDIVIMLCESLQEAEKITKSLNSNFAKSIIVYNTKANSK